MGIGMHREALNPKSPENSPELFLKILGSAIGAIPNRGILPSPVFQGFGNISTGIPAGIGQFSQEFSASVSSPSS